jgi:hypothetical protein
MTNALSQGRQADSARRRQRVIKALNAATTTGTEISVSAIARTALLTELDQEFLLLTGLIVIPTGTVPVRDRRW